MNHMRSLDLRPATQERLRQAALELFSSQGYQATSLRDLATHLELQPGSLYNHIESKQSLLFELMEDTLHDLLAVTRSELRKPGNRLHRFVCAYVEFQAGQGHRLTLLERESPNLSQEQRAHIDALCEDYVQCLTAILAEDAPGLASITLNRLSHACIGMLRSQSGWPRAMTALPVEGLAEHLGLFIGGALAAARRATGRVAL
ncbi:TetR/AcrR family transcriptional regulator [Pseudomonas sp. H9]|uniref:TetR/AcrR family transcriptional regulator n=1 Tax=Pseudomonas sp. H9 TaxID=483968 RepID=UPI0010580F93|nr:TetR/AcrR family transcriptional regulator [Pseudomonas sp. H9]TDF85958.1 TetR/AcrR family transcriptional regulator [Pseudomonas sp. H9]